MSHPDTTSKDAVFQWRGIPQPGQLLPLGLQHVVAAVVGVITPAILVADTCGLSSADKTLMIQVSLILTALATLLQLCPIFHRIGAGLPRSPPVVRRGLLDGGRGVPLGRGRADA